MRLSCLLLVVMAAGGAAPDAQPFPVTAAPIGGPVTIPASGGSFRFTVTITNLTAEPQSFQVSAEAVLPGGDVRGSLFGPRRLTLAPGQTLGPMTLRQSVPASAPAGAYTYRMEAGDGGSVVASASFPFEKLAGAGLGSRGDDTPEGWHAEQVGGPPLAAAGTGPSAPSAFGLGGLYPNPVQGGEVAVRLDLPARSAVTVRLFDVLGQEVLRLPPAVLEAGPARVMSLNVSGLSSGVYVYRVEVALAGGVEHASGRLTVVR